MLEKNQIKLVAVTNPFGTESVETIIPANSNVADIIRAAGVPLYMLDNVNVAIFDPSSNNDPLVVYKDKWHLIKPKQGMIINVRVVPTGGGGGSGGKNPLRTILMVAVMAAAIYFSGGLALSLLGTGASAGALSLTAGFISAGISVIGNMVINALIPPPKPKLQSLSSNVAGSPQLQITGTQNQASPFGVVPRLFGKFKMHPVVAAKQYVETTGDGTQYVRAIFDFGYGPLDLTDHKIGDTPIANFEDVEMEIRQGYDSDLPLTLYSNDMEVSNFSIKMDYNKPFTTNTPAVSNEVWVDFSFGSGLVSINPSTGGYENSTVTIRVEWRVSGLGGGWSSQDFVYTDNRQTPLRKSERIIQDNTGKLYEVKVTRLTADNTSTSVFNDVYFSSLRSVGYIYPINVKNRCLVAMRIKATNQLQGLIDQYNAVATSIMPVWNGTSWVEQPNRHPAWHYVEVMKGKANRNPVTDNRLDLVKLKAWYDATPTDTFDLVVDYETTVFELLKDILNSSKADFAINDGKFSIVRDLQQTTPRQVFTPRNSFGFKGNKIFKKLPHALKVRLTNADKDYIQDEVIVYDDGYSVSNATRFDNLDLIGITNRSLAWRRGRYYLAVARERSRIFELQTDLDHLVCTPGDLVKVVNDVPSFGGKSMRVISKTVNGGGAVTSVVIDDVFNFQLSTNYSCRVRFQDGSFALTGLVNPQTSVDQTTLNFVTPVAGLLEGDLVIVGITSQESKNLIVKSISHVADFKAKIMLIDEAPLVYISDIGTPPAFNNDTYEDSASAIPTLSNLTLTEIIFFQAGIPKSSAVLDWVPSSASLVQGYEVYLLKQSGYELETVVYNSNTFTLATNVPVGTTYTVKVLPFGIYNQKKLLADVDPVSITIKGDLLPPEDVTSFTVEDRNGDIRRFYWTYTNEQMDLAGFKIKVNPGYSLSWENAQPLHEHLVTEAPFETNALRTGTWTVLIKAVDTSGNESINTSSIIINLGDPILDNLVEEYDLSLSSWSGTTITNGTVDGNNYVVADSTGVLQWTDAAQNMWFNDNTKFYSDTYKTLTLAKTYKFFSNAELVVDYDGIGDSKILYNRPSGEIMFPDVDSALFWELSGDLMWAINNIYIPYTSPINIYKNEDYNFVLTMNEGIIQGVVKKLRLIIDAPSITEKFDDVVISSLGTRLTTDQELSFMKTCSLTVQSDGGTAVTARCYDKDAVLGALVYCLDASGTFVNGTVDATIQGYKI
jgi:predicted phage tail protein